MGTRELFSSQTVALVDEITVTNGTNYIFRGNNPSVSAGESDNGQAYSFAYETMASLFHSLIGGDFSLPNYRLVDVCLLVNTPPGSTDPASEYQSWLTEMNAFGVDYENQFPSQGTNGYSPAEPPYSQTNPPWIWGQLLGSGQVLSEKTYPGSLVWWPLQPGHESTGSSGYNYPGLIERVSELGRTPADKGTQGNVIYFHCMNGYDRTGAVHLGYLMTYGNEQNAHQPMSLSEACTIADYCTPRSNGKNSIAPKTAYQCMVRTYCTQSLMRSACICESCDDWITESTLTAESGD